MAKILLSIGDAVIREIPLIKGRLTIGRRPSNDIVIDDLAISGEHAVIVTQGTDYFLEDLNSTNGTQVNGQPVRQHFLLDNDTVELAKYRITFSAGAQQGKESGKCIAGQGEARLGDDANVPILRILTGPNAGKETLLANTITTIGSPGKQIAVITKHLNDHQFTHVEGAEDVQINGRIVEKTKQRLKHGDVICFSGATMVFLSTPRMQGR